MKKALTGAFLLIGSLAFSQDYRSLITTAHRLYRVMDYAESVKTYKEAFKIEQKSPTDLYNAGCSAALAGDTTLAFQWLDLAFKNGYKNVRHLQTDHSTHQRHIPIEFYPEPALE